MSTVNPSCNAGAVMVGRTDKVSKYIVKDFVELYLGL